MLGTQIAEKFRQQEQARWNLAARLERLSIMARLNRIALQTFLQTQPHQTQQKVLQALEQEIAHLQSQAKEIDGRYKQVLQETIQNWQEALPIHEKT